MNIERLKYFEKVMREFDRCNMETFQHSEYRGHGSGIGGIVNTLEKFHVCGNTACFAGRVALDPKFHADDGSIGPLGLPYYKSYSGEKAIAAYFGIPLGLADSLIYGDKADDGCSSYSNFYGKEWSDVRGPDVANKLQAIINGEIK